MRAVLGPLLLVMLIAGIFPLIQAGRHLRAPPPLPQRWQVSGGCLGSGAWELRQSGVFLHLIGAKIEDNPVVIRGRLEEDAHEEAAGGQARLEGVLEGEVTGGACAGAVIRGRARWAGSAWEAEIALDGCAPCPSARPTGRAGG